MITNNEMLWNNIYTFLLDCGNIRNPKDFSVQIIKKIFPLIPYDQARIYYLNDNGVIYDEYLFHVDKKWPRLYYEYYSKIEGGRYSIFSNKTNNGQVIVPKLEKCVYDWTKHENDEFLLDYIKPQRLRYSIGFGLHDVYNSLKITCIIDRTGYGKFTDKELNILNLVHCQLENLHKNFYVHLPNNDTDNMEDNINSQNILTTREAEIVELLSKGVTPTNISNKLCICQTTVYKHIAHIYKKMNVSNRQELLVKLMNTKLVK
ncbi:MAG: response regulator containing a CheY-like receiver domain and an DNA-binding domain [Clostridia bacterium]|jgi:DNA-binding CsgD family transcriptional regulator|nr:response regulator containing a CheY-like receiver domain and an DNA-binding domain [Clostridia bacterium]